MSETHPYPWLALLPDVIQHAAASTEHPLHDAFARWNGAARRLAMSAGESAVAAAIMAMEVDENIQLVAMGERAGLGCARSDVLRLLQPTMGRRALSGLVALEHRGVVASSQAAAGVWASAPVALDNSIRAHCLAARPDPPAPQCLELPARLRHAIDDIREATERVGAAGIHVVIRGRPGSGRDSILENILQPTGTSAYPHTPLQLRAVTATTLEPALSGRAAVWDARGYSLSPDDLAHAAVFLSRSTTVCVSLLGAVDDAPHVTARTTLTIDSSPANRKERRFAWQRALAARTASASAVADILSDCTRAGIGMAYRAAQTTPQPDNDAVESWVKNIYAQLQSVAQPSDLRGVVVDTPTAGLERLVLRSDTLERLQQMLSMIRHAATIATDGRAGAKALFSGPPGTGKTLAARCLAFEAGRPLYRVDLATIVSKWIGETEKNLRAALEAAEAVGAVLLFDEGDALFGARGNVERGADRYANMEVSYLLQALEVFDGTVIVTTNLRANIDRAFQRRFDFVIDFREPDAELRDALWRQELGNACETLSPALLDDIVRNAELAGGHIAVAARVARVLAIDAGGFMHDVELLRALSAELRKLGSNVAANRWDKLLATMTRPLRPIGD